MNELSDIVTPEGAAFQKTFSKKQRGRPQAFPETVVAVMPLENGTWRGRMNELYRLHVLSSLSVPSDPRSAFRLLAAARISAFIARDQRHQHRDATRAPHLIHPTQVFPARGTSYRYGRISLRVKQFLNAKRVLQSPPWSAAGRI